MGIDQSYVYLSVRPSVFCPLVTFVYCDKTKEFTVDISTPYCTLRDFCKRTVLGLQILVGLDFDAIIK